MALAYHGNKIHIHSRGTTASCYRCRIFIFSNNALILALSTWGQLPHNIVAYGVCTLFLIVYTCIIFSVLLHFCFIDLSDNCFYVVFTVCWLSCTLDLYFCILYLLPTTCNGGADTVAASCLAEAHARFVFQSNARNVQSGFDLIKLNGSASRACRMIYWVWLLWLRAVLVLPQTGESLLPPLCVWGVQMVIGSPATVQLG